jgi:hypothetical protein
MKKKLRRKLKTNVFEVADPTVTVLEPKLNDAKIILKLKIDIELDIL